jgi:anti-sigma regulatory factor (Ser/Thr protein kinase)
MREPEGEIAYLELAALPSAPFWARRQTRATLSAWQMWPETIEAAELLVSELVTNSISASGSVTEPRTYRDLDGIERVSLTLRLLPGRVVIEVFDHDPNPPVLASAGLDVESGRGLMLVAACSKEWGHFFLPTGGKVVFAVLGIPARDDGVSGAATC